MGNLFSNQEKRRGVTDSLLGTKRKKWIHQVEKMDLLESMDYRTPDNLLFREFYQRPDIKRRNVQKTVAKWILYLLIGLITGGIAFSIKQAIDHLHEFKMRYVEQYEDKKFISFLVYLGFNLLYGLSSCLIVFLMGPMAGGSGIPEVKGFLNGVRVVGTINLKTFLGKCISIGLAFSSCIPVGPEGPMVHIGSMVAGGLSSAKSRMLKIRLPNMFERIRTDKEQRDFISSGTAAGVAAAFGSPIGGALFAIEETSSFWSKELTWRTFFCCLVASFTVSTLFQVTVNDGEVVSMSGLLSFGLSRFYLFHSYEIPFFILLGVLGGILGSLFIKLNIKLNKFRRDKIRGDKRYQFLEVLGLVVVATVLGFSFTEFGHCRPISDISVHPNVCDNQAQNTTQVMSLYCPEGQYNDFVNLFMQPQDKALKLLFSRDVDIFSFQSIISFLIVYLPLVTFSAGMSVAAGLFVPMMLTGALYGRFIGKFVRTFLFHDVNPPIDSSVYALIGSTAMMSGFSRTTISMVVIVMELTQNTQFLLPIMVAVMSAKWVGDFFSHSIYEELMELKSITYLEHHPPSDTYSLTVQDVMASGVICVNEVESLSKIVDILKNTKHNGFPVVRKVEENERTFCGLILRKHLLVLLHFKIYEKLEGRPEIDWQQWVAATNRKWSLSSIQLPESLDEYTMDLRPYMDRSSPIVLETSSFIDGYRSFQLQGLRHLTVVDDRMQVVGILTRHDMLSFFHSMPTSSSQLSLNSDDDSELQVEQGSRYSSFVGSGSFRKR